MIYFSAHLPYIDTNMLSVPSTLYYASAIISTLTIPKHYIVGASQIDRAVNAIPEKPEFRKAKQITTPTWQYLNFYLAVNGKSTLLRQV